MFACACANPDCLVNGCAQARRYQRTDVQIGFGHFTPAPLTADDVRRIIREELAESRKASRTQTGASESSPPEVTS